METKRQNLKPQEKTVAGHTFSFIADVDEKTGAFAWTKETQEAFNAWLSGLYKSHKSAFTIQGIQVPNAVKVLIDDFLRRHPGGAASDVIRAAVLVYFDLLRDQSRTAIVEQIYQQGDYQSFLDDGKLRKTNVRFKPALFIDIEGWAAGFGMTPAQVVSEAVKRVMACYFRVIAQEYEELVREVQARVEAYLKAA